MKKDYNIMLYMATMAINTLWNDKSQLFPCKHHAIMGNQLMIMLEKSYM